MRIEAKAEIYNMSLCSTDKDNDDPLKEISLSLHFKSIEYPELIDMSADQVEEFFADGIHKNITMDKGSPILRGTFNVTIDGDIFKGESFSSATAGMVKKIGAVTKLHLTLKFSKKFWEKGPDIFRKMINVFIEEVNEQLEIPQQGEDGKEKTPF
jgi:hypothetical protein